MKLAVVLFYVAMCGARNWDELNACAARILERYASESVVYIFERGYEMFEVVNPNKSSMVLLYEDDFPFELHKDSTTRTFLFLSLKYTGSLKYLLDESLDWADYIDEVVLVFHDYKFIDGVFRFFWYYYYTKVLYVSPSLDVYTYYPLSEDNCTTARPVHLGKCGSAEVKFRDEGRYISNCALRVHCIDREPYAIASEDFETNKGLEVAILRKTMSKLKNQVVFTVAEFGYRTYLKIPGHSADVLCGGFSSRWPDFGAVYSGVLAELATFVPRATPKDPAENILAIFDLATWICSFGCFVTFTILWAYLNKAKISTTFMYTLSSIIASVPSMPGTNRPLFALWLLAGMVATNAFVGLLTSFMFHPGLKPQLSSLEELVEKEWDLEEASRTPYFRWSAPEQYIIDHMNACFDPKPCFQSLHKDKWAYYDDVRRTVRFVKEDRTLTLYKFYETIYPVHFVLHLRSIFIESLTKAITQLVEGGLIELTSDWNSLQVLPSTTIQAIKLSHVYFIFALVIVGHSLAFISFALEKVVRF